MASTFTGSINAGFSGVLCVKKVMRAMEFAITACGAYLACG
jgi:hypothetical protein